MEREKFVASEIFDIFPSAVLVLVLVLAGKLYFQEKLVSAEIFDVVGKNWSRPKSLIFFPSVVLVLVLTLAEKLVSYKIFDILF